MDFYIKIIESVIKILSGSSVIMNFPSTLIIFHQSFLIPDRVKSMHSNSANHNINTREQKYQEKEEELNKLVFSRVERAYSKFFRLI